MEYDALATMPEPIRSWADKKGLQSLVKRYGWSLCKVCGLIGIPWSTDWLPGGANLDFETEYKGWMHPSVDVRDFGKLWGEGKEPEKLNDREKSYFFDLFMKSLTNSWGLGPEYRHAKGKTNPWDFCFSNMVSFGTRKGGGKGCARNAENPEPGKEW